MTETLTEAPAEAKPAGVHGKTRYATAASCWAAAG
jgi:hypothetical protein